MHACIEGSGESVQMCRLIWAFSAHNSDKYKQSYAPAHLTRPACFAYLIGHNLARDSNLGVDDFQVIFVQGSKM